MFGNVFFEFCFIIDVDIYEVLGIEEIGLVFCDNNFELDFELGVELFIFSYNLMIFDSDED